MDTLDYTGHISTTNGSNDMIEGPLESQDQLLYLTSPTLSIILTPSSATSQPLQNCQTLQWFLSPLYMGSGVNFQIITWWECRHQQQGRTLERMQQPCSRSQVITRRTRIALVTMEVEYRTLMALIQAQKP